MESLLLLQPTLHVQGFTIHSVKFKINSYPIERFEVKAGSNLGDGYTCAMLSVEVWKQSDPNHPFGIVVKCYPVNQTRQDFLETANIFQVELGMYDTVIPALNKFQEILPERERVPLPFAPMIFGKFLKPEDRSKLGRPLEPLDNSIVMPDLRKPENGPFVLRDRFLGFDLDHYLLVIEAQARLHATSWAYKSKLGKNILEEFPFLESKLGEIFKSVVAYQDANVNTIAQLVQDSPKLKEGLSHLQTQTPSIIGLYFDCDFGQKERGHTKDNILKKPQATLDNEEPWLTLIHGDCWSNNLMFRYDQKTGKPIEVVFIDLQISRETDPMIDICYGLYFNPQPDLRQKHLQTILRIYFDTFTDICKKFDVPAFPGWSWEEFNRRFHRAKLLGGFMAMSIPMILKNTDQLENLDDMMAKVEVSGNGDKTVSENLVEMFANMPASKPHPAVKPRISTVLQELVDDGII
ncbi:unnamed protein product [Allacma fusca]|uniref:CHK kinase-like domain-containing protein n=1 Tax=Allacma fusca TaxID=39272 RepID=A0A8J2Q638_9HEXA|nr:unnamed protein product [Allacma fusca]